VIPRHIGSTLAAQFCGLEIRGGADKQKFLFANSSPAGGKFGPPGVFLAITTGQGPLKGGPRNQRAVVFAR